MAVLFLAAGCSEAPPPGRAVISDALKSVSVGPDPAAQACAQCHPKEVDQWLASQHANANRLFSNDLDAHVLRSENRLGARPEAVIGITPLVQYLLPFPGGRLQTHELSYDPRSNEWFNVYGDEDRQPHEWGYWKNRSMNWNSQCAFCHMTEFRKNYDPATDAYASSWKAMGISCAQCHAMVSPVTSNRCPVVESGHRSQVTGHISSIDNCATCHSRREQMTDTYMPGDAFHDHFRLALAGDPSVYYPDGQVLSENYEYGSFLMSRMHHKGITCMDCHDPHSAKLKMPVENNTLCLTCHAPPGQRNATLIDVATHTRHPAGSIGNRCVECHMPHTTYMQRDPRRDHGFTSPDPLLTRELGIPNACNTCHADKSVDWSIDRVNEWYGDKMEQRPARARARVIARAQAGDASNVSNLLETARSEEIDFWRATLVALLEPWVDRADVRAFLVSLLDHENPLVRAAAVNAYRPAPGSYAGLKRLRQDSSRLVRTDAAWATMNPLERDAASYQDVVDYIDVISDQPAGAIRRAQKALAENQPAEAERWARKAAEWDPSAASQHVLGRFLHAAHKSDDAAAAFRRACELDPANAQYPYALALLYGEMNRPEDSLRLLQEAVKLAPTFGRAWYNLGLAHAALEQLSDATSALETAERNLADSPDAPYALATVYARRNMMKEASDAAARALRIAPDYQPALDFLSRLR